MFQIYVTTDEGKKYAGKSLPVIAKNRNSGKNKVYYPKAVIVYAGPYFGIFPFVEFLQLYASLAVSIRERLDPILAYAYKKDEMK